MSTNSKCKLNILKKYYLPKQWERTNLGLSVPTIDTFDFLSANHAIIIPKYSKILNILWYPKEI